MVEIDKENGVQNLCISKNPTKMYWYGYNNTVPLSNAMESQILTLTTLATL